MLAPFTIESDDEIEPESLSEDEFGHNMSTAVNHSKKGKIFAFDFDDGVVSSLLYRLCALPADTDSCRLCPVAVSVSAVTKTAPATGKRQRKTTRGQKH